jgi:ABC-2 type transport system ATP-binding protein
MGDDVVRAREVRRNYRGVPALDGVDLTVSCGEVYALLGPNGAGKTTMVEILEGHRRRDSGTVTVLGIDPAGANMIWRCQIGVVPQEARDLPELTVAETVRHFAGYYPRPRAVDEVLDLVGLTGQSGYRLRQLSGGQRRRVDVAIGIVGRPRLLFLDEPTTGFDPQARRHFWHLIRTLAHTDDMTILLTTHYLEEAEALADRIGVLRAGRIVAEGHPATIGGRRPVTTTVIRPTLEEVYLQLVEEVPR